MNFNNNKNLKYSEKNYKFVNHKKQKKINIKFQITQKHKNVFTNSI